MDITVEICSEGAGKAIAAWKAGAGRIELCENLAVGGVTPSRRDIETAVASAGIPVNVLIRPRGGDFTYSRSEMDEILEDIRFCGEGVFGGKKVNGVVIGALDANGRVDIARTGEMADLAVSLGLSVTFHRAIDVCEDILRGFDDVLSIGGIDRVLTSGGAETAFLGRDTIAEMVRRAKGRVSVMAGCGVTGDNALAIVKSTGIHEIHGSRVEITKALE